MPRIRRQLRRLCSRRARRGMALYATVLSTTLIVSLLAMSALMLVRVEHKQASQNSQLLISRMHAQSAVQYALRQLKSDPSWRTNYTNGVETAPVSLGANVEGTISWMLEDSDGSLTDADVNLRLKGIGRVGSVVQVVSTKIEGVAQVLDSLLCSVYSVGDVTQASTSTTNSGPFASAGTLFANGNIVGDAEGNPVVIVGSVSGTVTDPGPVRTMPSPDVWDTYMSLATTIPWTNLPIADIDPIDPNVREVYRNMISGATNPFGSVNAEGIYHIQIPDGGKFVLAKSRLHGTLLIELVGNAEFVSERSCLWDPYLNKNYPAAIVKGTGAGLFTLKGAQPTLKENQQPKFNFNSPGDPYDGITDTDNNDSYQPLLRGLFHIIGSNVHTQLTVNLEIEGVVVSEGTMTLGANLEVTLDPSIYANPPLGYSNITGNMQAVEGTWRPAAAP